MSRIGPQILVSAVWKTFANAEAVRVFFEDHISPQSSEAIARVARGESMLVRLLLPGPLDWIRRPLVTCVGRGDGGVDLFVADLNTLGDTLDEAMAKIRAASGLRSEGFQMWRVEKWVPPPSVTAGPIRWGGYASRRSD